jgi:copper chaperone CopZ
MALLSAGCSSPGSKANQDESAGEISLAEENLTEIHLSVKGMTCEGCENAITASIGKLDGIREATASHTKEETIVVYDSSQTTMDDISRAIQAAGYTVEGEITHREDE